MRPAPALASLVVVLLQLTQAIRLGPISLPSVGIEKAKRGRSPPLAWLDVKEAMGATAVSGSKPYFEYWILANLFDYAVAELGASSLIYSVCKPTSSKDDQIRLIDKRLAQMDEEEDDDATGRSRRGFFQHLSPSDIAQRAQERRQARRQLGREKTLRRLRLTLLGPLCSPVARAVIKMAVLTLRPGWAIFGLVRVHTATGVPISTSAKTLLALLDMVRSKIRYSLWEATNSALALDGSTPGEEARVAFCGRAFPLLGMGLMDVADFLLVELRGKAMVDIAGKTKIVRLSY